MKIIPLSPNPSGAYPIIQDGYKGVLPEGYALVPEELDTGVFYTHAGFVTLEVEDGVVTGMTANQAAHDAWLASLPEPEEPAPTASEQLRADVDFLAAMAGVSL